MDISSKPHLSMIGEVTMSFIVPNYFDFDWFSARHPTFIIDLPFHRWINARAGEDRRPVWSGSIDGCGYDGLLLRRADEPGQFVPWIFSHRLSCMA
jgi:hypothetical protein